VASLFVGLGSLSPLQPLPDAADEDRPRNRLYERSANETRQYPLTSHDAACSALLEARMRRS
jgi:hypothetical protein